VLSEKKLGKWLFVECLTWHSAKKRRRHGTGAIDGFFAECQLSRHSAKKFNFFSKFFAEC
jgi:hypothetical protein